MANEFRLLESFGAFGDGEMNDRDAIQEALDWSADNGIPVYGFHDYRLGSRLLIPANATLIATPTARFIRAFGGVTSQDQGGFPLVTTDGVQPNIRIQGGLWNGVLSYDLPDENPEPWIADITFTAGSGATGKIAFPDAKRKFFHSDDSPRDVLQQIWVYQKDANGDFDPTVINNNKLFKVTGFDGVNRILVEAVDGVVTAGTVTGMTGSYVPRAGSMFDIDSPGGVIDGVGIVMPRGIQFQLQGDGFVLTRSWSRNPPPDGGGGVRFARGRGMRGTLLDLESIDDCFQFNPADKAEGELTGATVEQGSYADCLGRTYQGALVAFINGNGRAYLPDAGGASKDSLTSLRDCLASNVRGASGGSADHGGVAVKVYCANSSKPLANCWIEDVFVRQSSVVPADTLRAGVMIVTGRPGGGVVNSGARNLVIENRTGPLVAITPADGAPEEFSKAVEFTLEQARPPGADSGEVFPCPSPRPRAGACFAAGPAVRRISFQPYPEAARRRSLRARSAAPSRAPVAPDPRRAKLSLTEGVRQAAS